MRKTAKGRGIFWLIVLAPSMSISILMVKHISKNGVDDYIAWISRGGIGHYKSTFARLIDITSQLRVGVPWIIVATEIENNMLQTRLNGYLKGEMQYLNKEMSVLIDNPYIEIVETIEKDKLVYPDDERMSIDNVRYIKWTGGKHWYAKVGRFDVVDKHNNQKWDTKEEAEEAAKWFIEENNKQN